MVIPQVLGTWDWEFEFLLPDQYKLYASGEMVDAVGLKPTS